MNLNTEQLERLDWQNEHDAALAAEETLNILHQIATDPESYTIAQFDAGYTRAEELAHALCGMALGYRAKEIAREFKHAAKAREMCRKYALVPLAKYDELRARLEQAKTAKCAQLSVENVRGALHPGVYIPNEAEDLEVICARLNACLAANLGGASIGPGDPLPPPPPPTKGVAPWTGEELYCTAKTAATAQAGVWSSQNDYQQKLWDAAAQVVNKRMGIKAP